MGLLVVEELNEGPQPLRVLIVQLRQLRDILVNIPHLAHVEYLKQTRKDKQKDLPTYIIYTVII